MRKKRISNREARRIASRRRLHGPDFESKNARHAASFTLTKFNSVTGKEAAQKRWRDHRAKQARLAGTVPGGTR